MTAAEFAAECIASCSVGFDNEHHWMAWKRKWDPQIQKLPIPLRNKVVLAWEQASAREFSNPKEGGR